MMAEKSVTFLYQIFVSFIELHVYI